MKIRKDNEIQNILNEIDARIEALRQIAARVADECESAKSCKYWVDGFTGELKKMYDLTPPNLELIFKNGILVSAKVLK